MPNNKNGDDGLIKMLNIFIQLTTCVHDLAYLYFAINGKHERRKENNIKLILR